MALPQTQPATQLIELDARGRTTIRLGEQGRYRATAYPDGTLLLEPVVELTKDELALRAIPSLEARLEEAMGDRSNWVRRSRPQKVTE